MAPHRATIVDIARELGISKSAVANVLSGTGRFSAETSERVHAAAARLGYVGNRSARHLRTGRVGAYGLHLPAVARRLPFYAEFALGVADGADSARADVTLFRATIEPSRRFAVDAAIVVDPEPGEPAVAALAQAGIPVLSVGAYRGPGAEDVLATLDARHESLQCRVLDHLGSRGRRRLVLASPARLLGSAWALDTRQTFLDWCARNGADGVVFDIDPNPAEWNPLPLVEAIADHRADALVCAAQGFAHVARVVLGSTDAVIGESIDIVSFAASPDEANDPLQTVIDLNPTAYGREAAWLVAELLEAGPEGPPKGSHHWFDGARVHLAD